MGWSDWLGVWFNAKFELSQYSGHIIRIRFNFGTDNQNVLWPGWYIDDVYIHDSMGAPEDYVTEHPQSGEIFPNFYNIISINVDASKLQLGEYHEFISIRSNDPNEPRTSATANHSSS